MTALFRPNVKSRRELKLLGNEVAGLEADVTLILGGLGLDPLEYVKHVPNPYFVSGVEDDIIVTKQARSMGRLLDGRCVSISDTIFCGVGGLNPHQDMERVLRITSGGVALSKVTVSHHPPHKCGDLISELSVHRGLLELNKFINSVKPLTHISGGEYVDSCLINGVRVYTVGPRNALLISVNRGNAAVVKHKELEFAGH